MSAYKLPLFALTLALIGALPLAAQKKPISPHETISAEIGGDQLTLSYGRPYIKDPKTGEPRKIWGGLVPYGKVWRTGANEATVITTTKTLVFANGSTLDSNRLPPQEKDKMGVKIPAGSYSLWTIPEADGSAKLVFNKTTGQWGTKHDPKDDFVAVSLEKKSLTANVDQFTMALDKEGSGGSIVLSWEMTQYSAVFTVE